MTGNTRRKRRQAVRISERDEEPPWPQPQSIESFRFRGIPADLSLNLPLFENDTLAQCDQSDSRESVASSSSKVPGAQAQPIFDDRTILLKDRNTLESVHQKLNLLLREQSSFQSQSPISNTDASPFRLPPHGAHSSCFNYPTEKPSVYGSVSSNELCTLYQSTLNPSHLSTSNQPPPIGVFWDIENCQVPRGKSALVAVQLIRERFFSRFQEADFVCVCDIRKESPQVIQELNDAQVSVVHVSGNSKNAADDKLRQAMRRYADVYSTLRSSVTSCPSPAVLLISGDINFATDLSDLRYRKRLYVVLLHNKHAPDALILCAHEHYDFHSILDNLPDRVSFPGRDVFHDSQGIPLKGGHCPMDVVVTDLPNVRNISKLKNRLKRLSDNCGGKVITIQGQFAVIRFPNQETAQRASKRMNGEDVFGSKIRVVYSSQMELKNSEIQNQNQHQSQSQMHSSPIPVVPSTPLVDLHVTNIDPNIGDWKLIRQTLMNTFGEHVTVRGLWVYTGQDGAVSSIIRVSNKEEAHYAVAQLHRRSIGTKRIFISFGQGIAVDQAILKREVAALLQDVPNHSLPLFKFREMFEKRYRRSISASDLYRMKDVITISDSSSSNCSSPGSSSSNGRSISLTHEWETKRDEGLDVYCKTHPPVRDSVEHPRRGWAEKEVGITLPNVVFELKPFSKKVHSMLQSHNGGLPLLSFLDCYESEFGVMEVAEDGNGVPLEHFIASVQGVEICFSENGMKKVQWSEKKELDTGLSQAMAVQLAQLSRELVDLLKTFPRCSIQFSKLIPAYHHHFGRQCRVADYGHFSLSALLQTLPLTIQIMGEAQDRIVTLAHRAQMKRFATDVLRVLKAQVGIKKQVRMDEFNTAFSQVYPARQFFPEDYGLCFFTDLVSELIDNSLLVALVKDDDGTNILAIPKREQTPQEVEKTRTFATEVVELLSHSIRCEMPFSKFIPSYHHHFGRQCRVSDYGFSKLAELFEAVGSIACTFNPSSNSECSPEDKTIRLTPPEQIKVIGEQVCKLVEKRELTGATGAVTRIEDLDDLFLDEHGFVLRPELCEAEDLEDLVRNKLKTFVQASVSGVISVIGERRTKHTVPTKGSGHQISANSSNSYSRSNKLHSPLKNNNHQNGQYSKTQLGGTPLWTSSAQNIAQNIVGPPPLYSPTLSSPNYPLRAGEAYVFTFDRSTSLTPPMYDMWMRDGAPGSPPLSPPVVWTYHPLGFPSPPPPGATSNVLMPTFSYGAPWSPPPSQTMMPSACYDHAQQK